MDITYIIDLALGQKVIVRHHHKEAKIKKGTDGAERQIILRARGLTPSLEFS